jgi:hypothetical protein
MGRLLRWWSAAQDDGVHDLVASVVDASEIALADRTERSWIDLAGARRRWAPIGELPSYLPAFPHGGGNRLRTSSIAGEGSVW